MMKRHIYYIFLAFFITSFFNTYSQRAEFEKENIFIGDQILFYLEFPADIAKNIEFPKLSDTLTEGIEIINEFDQYLKEDENVFRKDYVITSFEDSLFLLHPFQIIADNKLYQTNASKLRVKYYEPDSALISSIDTTGRFQVTDILAPVDLPLTFKEIFIRFWFVLIILFVVIISFFTFRYFKKKKSISVKVIPQIEKSAAHEIALKSLNDLKFKKLHEEENLKPFYTEMSFIIRKYLEDRYKIEALESVTYEILEEFSVNYNDGQNLQNDLRTLLTLSDYVKFAKNKPNTEENLKMFDLAYDFVNKTKEMNTDTDSIDKEKI